MKILDQLVQFLVYEKTNKHDCNLLKEKYFYLLVQDAQSKLSIQFLPTNVSTYAYMQININPSL